MKFNEFLNKENYIRTTKLGGLDSQFKLAPKLRRKYNAKKINSMQPKKAAVLALFYPNELDETMFLLTQRANYKGVHSAQISFPGGKIEKQDTNLAETALRETYEEVGIHQENIKIIREITDVYIPPSNFLATPFIGYIDKKPAFNTNNEVHKIIEVPVAELLNDDNIDSIIMNTSYMDNISVPCFRLNDYIVWGATGMMLSEIKEMLKF